MAGIKIHKLEGSSLLEVIIATVVMMIVMGIGTMIYSNVVNSSYTFQKKKADLLLNEKAIDTKINHKLFNEETEVDNFTIKREVSKYQNTDDIYIINLKAFNNEEKLISERKELLLVNENN